MSALQALTSNDLVNLCFFAWAAAQVLKTIINWVLTKKLSFERLVGAGGMPSAHSALVVSLTIGIARQEGFRSALFAMALAFAGIVMYDAMGVRRAAGEQAKVINKMMFSFNDFSDMFRQSLFFDDMDDTVEANNEDDQVEDTKLEHQRLKEYLGHTPMEVLGGALLGILIAVLYQF